MNIKIRTVFMGTPEFAVPFLKLLKQLNYIDLVAVVTQPDKQIGRKKIVTSPEVKICATDLNLSTLQPPSVRDPDFISGLLEIKPDLIFVVAYGKILPKEIIDIPKFGCVNIHASLLPQYRGSSPIQHSILSGDKETGVAMMKMDVGMDTGDIIYQESLAIGKQDTYESLGAKLSFLGVDLTLRYLKKYLDGEIVTIKQDDELATYCKMIKKEDGEIHFDRTATEIERMIRAYSPWPGIYTFKNGKKIAITQLRVANQFDTSKKVGEFYLYDKKIYVNCKEGSLNLLRLKPEGKKEMSATDYSNGYM